MTRARVTLHDYDPVVAEAEAVLLALGNKRMTAEDIRNRNYTYVSATYVVGDLDWVKFIVGLPFKAEAMQRARAYLVAFEGRRGEPEDIHLYPRNYVDDARVAFIRGRHD